MKKASTIIEKKLSLFDSISIIIGIIIGAGIYETSATIASCMGGWTGILGIWFAGGLLALTGAFCYAELATAYPHQGGDYQYLSRAYGRGTGFLFGWSQLLIIRPGDIALLAFVFARYAQQLYNPFAFSGLAYAGGAVVILTIINIIGVREGKTTQNVLTVLKILGILAIILAGFLAPGHNVPVQERMASFGGIKLALILVLFTFGGWNEIAYVAAEVKQPKKNIFRTLVIGTITVTLLYVLINGAFFRALGFEKMAASKAIATDTIASFLPETAGKAISILICISALGAINGLTFTGARISYAFGKEHTTFSRIGHWSKKHGTPIGALILQGTLGLGIILLAGSFIDTILYAAPAVWIFFLYTGLSVFILRKKEPKTPRPHKVVGYPIIPLLFCGSCLFMLYSSVTYAFSVKPVGLMILSGILLAGNLFYLLIDSRKSK